MEGVEYKIWEHPKGCFQVVITGWEAEERVIRPLLRPWCLLPQWGEIVKKWHRRLPKHRGEPENWNLYEIPGELSYYIESSVVDLGFVYQVDNITSRLLEWFNRRA